LFALLHLLAMVFRRWMNKLICLPMSTCWFV
jgi:hypothetical protein